MSPEPLQLLSRRRCPLCERTAAMLREAAPPSGLAVAEFDVDEDEALRLEFGDRVPVIRHRGRVVAEGRIGSTRLREVVLEIARESR